MSIHYDDGVNVENEAIIQIAIQIILYNFRLLYLLSSHLDQWVQNFELYRTFEFNNSFKWLRMYLRVSVKIFEFLGAPSAKPAIKDDDKKTKAIIINLNLLRINQSIKIIGKLACRLLIPYTNLT
jgi:hypothetical protein